MLIHPMEIIYNLNMKHLKPYNEEYIDDSIDVDKLRDIIQLYRECFIDIFDAGAIIEVQPNREGTHHIGLWDRFSDIDDNSLNHIVKIVRKYNLKTLHFHIKDMYQAPDNLIEDPYEKVNPAKSQERLCSLYDEVTKNLQAGEDKFNSISSNKLSNVSTRIEIITKEEYTEDDSDEKRIRSISKTQGITSWSSTGTPLGNARLTGYTIGIRKRRGIVKKIKDFIKGGYRYEFPNLEKVDKIRNIDITHEINI